MDWTNINCVSEKIGGYDCRLLLRKEGHKPLVIIGLNPSAANESAPDATMRKILGFISTWSKSGARDYDSFIMLNLYPQRETSPCELNKKSRFINEMIHCRNMEMVSSILNAYQNSDILLCYGDSIEIVTWMKQCKEDILKLLTKYPDVSLYSLRELTKRKNPRHPCRLAYKTKLMPFINPFQKKQ